MTGSHATPTGVRVVRVDGVPRPGLYDALRRDLSRQLTTNIPGLVAAEPRAVQQALDVAADVIGEVLGLAKLAHSTDDYAEVAVKALMRADRVADACKEAALADVRRPA